MHVLEEPTVDALDGELARIMDVVLHPFADIEFESLEEDAELGTIDEREWPFSDDQADLTLPQRFIMRGLSAVPLLAARKNLEGRKVVGRADDVVVPVLGIIHPRLAAFQHKRLGIGGVFL